jgi:oxygen-dependent protoporphyrinogen oxidase
MKIAIIGGGISGLTTAFYIKRAKPEWEVSVFEKDKELGGKMKTVNIEGFLFEEGSNGFLSNKPDTLDLVEQSDCSDILLRSSDDARIRFIFTDKLYTLPESPGAFLKTPLLSLKGKLRVAMEYFIAPKKDDSDETLQSFGYRRVGQEMTDVFLDAMVAGIYASTPDKISVNAAFPAVVKLEKEYGGLFRGMLAKRKKDAGPGGVLMSFKGGVSSFIQRLSKVYDIDILKDITIDKIEKEGTKFRVFGENVDMSFDKIVLSTEAFESARILGDFNQELVSRLNDIEYSPISIVGLGYDKLEHDLKGFGLLCTTSAKKEILGVLWDSSIFFDRAPTGKKSLRVMIGGQRNPNLAIKSDEELLKIAIDGVRETMGIDKKPDISYVKRYERGIPNYKVGHLENVDKIFKLVKKIEGLYLSSNAYYGVGLNDCVSNSKKCAMEVVSD